MCNFVLFLLFLAAGTPDLDGDLKRIPWKRLSAESFEHDD